MRRSFVFVVALQLVFLINLTNLNAKEIDKGNTNVASNSIDNSKKLDELSNEIKITKKEILDGTIQSYNRSSDAANRLISVMGVFATVYGILIAIASVIVGYVSIMSKKRRDEAITTLEGAKDYIENQVKVFDDQVEFRLTELNKKVDEAIQIMLVQLSQDAEDAVKQLNLGAEEVSKQINQSAEELANKIKEIEEQNIVRDTERKMEYLVRKVKLFEELGIPNDPKLLYSKAMIYKEKKQYINASELLEKIISIDPSNKNAYWNLGVIYYLLNEDEKAIQAYDKVIEISPNEHIIYHNKGLSLFKLGKIDGAIDNFDKAIQLNAGVAQYYISKANAYELNEQNINTITKLYDKAMELEPNKSIFPLAIGKKLHELDKIEEAKRYYSIYTDLIKNNLNKEDAKESDFLCYYEGLIITERYDEAVVFENDSSNKITTLKYLIVYKWLTGCVLFMKNNNTEGNQVMKNILDEMNIESVDKISWNFDDVYPFIKYKLNDKDFTICDYVKKAFCKEIPIHICKSNFTELSLQ